MFKTKRPEMVREAVQCYSRALEEARPSDPHLRALLHLNRAAAHLALQNYGHALADARATLAIEARALVVALRLPSSRAVSPALKP